MVGILPISAVTAASSGAAAIVLDIDTLGGRLDSAERIGKLIRGSVVPTTAFVHGRAVSAGSYIALNANKIVMEPGGTIGSAAVIDQSGKEIDSAKIISHWSSEMRSAAELRGRNPDIAEGMVDKQVNVDMPQIGKKGGNGTIVSLTAEEALKVGYADYMAVSLDETLSWMGLSGAQIISFEPSFSENLARWLVNPVVMTVLLLVGLVGVAIELLLPGFALPGVVGALAFALYFFGHYVAGFAGIEHVILFIAGIVLLILEIFVPSFGIMGILGIAAIMAGVVLAAFDTKNALLSLGIATVLAAITVTIVAVVFKRYGVWNKFILRDELSADQGYVSFESKHHLFGALGVAVTPLRPAGIVDIEGEKVDVVTEGEYIDANRSVMVFKIEGGRVVVKQV